MGLNKDKLVFDETAIASSDQVGAHILGSSSVKITSTTVGPKEALDVNIVSASGEGIYAEDSASVDGDLGQFVLAVQNSSESSLVSADGDYAAFQLNSVGRLKTNLRSEHLHNDVFATNDSGILALVQRTDNYSSAMGNADADYSQMRVDQYGKLWVNNAASWSGIYGQFTATTTATSIMVRQSGGVKTIVQNVGNKECYLGFDASVTSANGIQLASGGSIELDCGPNLELFAITASGTTDLRWMDLA